MAHMKLAEIYESMKKYSEGHELSGIFTIECDGGAKLENPYPTKYKLTGIFPSMDAIENSSDFKLSSLFANCRMDRPRRGMSETYYIDVRKETVDLLGRPAFFIESSLQGKFPDPELDVYSLSLYAGEVPRIGGYLKHKPVTLAWLAEAGILSEHLAEVHLPNPVTKITGEVLHNFDYLDETYTIYADSNALAEIKKGWIRYYSKSD